jgi:hypothetical protein
LTADDAVLIAVLPLDELAVDVPLDGVDPPAVDPGEDPDEEQVAPGGVRVPSYWAFHPASSV